MRAQISGNKYSINSNIELSAYIVALLGANHNAGELQRLTTLLRNGHGRFPLQELASRIPSLTDE